MNTKAKKITYWIATVWLSLGMTSAAIIQIIQLKEEALKFDQLGLPHYLMPLLGIWKILGVIAILIPKFPLLKEWAYAGFFFTASGAIVCHAASGDQPAELFGPSLLLVLILVSWYFRPDSRRVQTAK